MKADLKFLFADTGDWVIVLLNEKLLLESHSVPAAALAQCLIGYEVTSVERFWLRGAGEEWASWYDIKDWRMMVKE